MFRFVNRPGDNQCYLNATVQVLTTVPALKAFLIRSMPCRFSDKCISCVLRAVVTRSPRLATLVDVAKMFTSKHRLRVFGDRVANALWRQECAAEFLERMLETWREDVLHFHSSSEFDHFAGMGLEVIGPGTATTPDCNIAVVRRLTEDLPSVWSGDPMWTAVAGILHWSSRDPVHLRAGSLVEERADYVGQRDRSSTSGHWTALVQVGGEWLHKDDACSEMAGDCTLDVSLLSMDVVVYVRNGEQIMEALVSGMFNPITATHPGSGDLSAENRSMQSALQQGISERLDGLQLSQELRQRAMVTSEVAAHGMMAMVNR